jgi:hypothetical protein
VAASDTWLVDEGRAEWIEFHGELIVKDRGPIPERTNEPIFVPH